MWLMSGIPCYGTIWSEKHDSTDARVRTTEIPKNIWQVALVINEVVSISVIFLHTIIKNTLSWGSNLQPNGILGKKAVEHLLFFYVLSLVYIGVVLCDIQYCLCLPVMLNGYFFLLRSKTDSCAINTFKKNVLMIAFKKAKIAIWQWLDMLNWTVISSVPLLSLMDLKLEKVDCCCPYVTNYFRRLELKAVIIWYL